MLLLTLGSRAFAEDVTVELGQGDGFSVRDDQGAERFRVDSLGNTVRGRAHLEWLPPALGGTAEDNEVALALTTGVDTENTGDLTIPIVFIRKDKGAASGFFDPGGALWTSTYLKLDGSVRATYDENTRKLTITDRAIVPDPQGGPHLASMAQIGADVETTVMLRGSNAPPVNGRPKQKLILGLDFEDDWVWKVEDDGVNCWGSPTEKGPSSWDVCLERVDDAGYEYPRFTLDYDDSPVTVDIKAPLVQGTGAATHGPMLWGDGSDAFDTGDEICQTQGLSCQTTFAVDGINQTCGFDHGATGSYFYAFCK